MTLHIELDIPEGVVDRDFEKALREDAVLRLFAEPKIPSGHATRLLGLTRMQFLEVLDNRGISHLEHTADDWDADRRAIAEFERRRQRRHSGD